MRSRWPLFPLGEFLEHRKEFIQIDDLVEYKRCRVQLHARGILLRDQLSGAEIKTKKQQVCRKGEFLVAEIDAKLGGYGIVPAELDDSIVSSHYFLFEIDEAKLDRQFLGYYIRTPAFHDQVAAQGSTNYAAIRPDHVLEYTIPMPTPDEQKLLVNQIDALASKIEEAKRLRGEAAITRQSLWHSVVEREFLELAEFNGTVRQILSRVKRPVTLVPGEEYKPAGLTNQAKGIISYPPIDSSMTKYETLFQIHTDDLLYSKLKVWEGSLAIVLPEHHGRVVSSEFPMFTVDYERVSGDFLDLWLRRPSLWKSLGEQVRGIGGRKIRVDEATFLKATIPLPPRSIQREVAERLQACRQFIVESEGLQNSVHGELDALLPAILDQAFQGKLL